MNPVLYLHGFASGPASTKARYLRDRLDSLGFEVQIPDLAAGNFEHLTITGQLGVVERAADGRPVSLVGSSMGGYLAALYAARHPEVPRLVLLAPAFDFARRWQEYLGPSQIEAWRRYRAMDVFHYADNRARRLHYGLLEDASQYEAFPDFLQPVLIFHGVHDDVVPVSLSQQFAAAHPNARLEILDSGHELLNALGSMAEKIPDFLLGRARDTRRREE